MALFSAEQHRFVNILLQTEGRRCVQICFLCAEELDEETGIYSCDDCLGKPQLCKPCAVESHFLQPFHRIRVWNGEYFAKEELALLGVRVYLGHEGWRCPNQPAGSRSSPAPPNDNEWRPPQDHREYGLAEEDDRSRNAKTLVVGHSNGYHRVRIIPCCCPASPPVWQQMLWRGLWPATFAYPETAFTLECLRLGRSLNLECKTSISAFHTLLETLTSLPFGVPVPVSHLHPAKVVRPCSSSLSE